MFDKLWQGLGVKDELLTVAKAADFLGVSTSTLRNWDRAGKLVPVRHPLNRYRMYKRSDLARLMDILHRHVSARKAK